MIKPKGNGVRWIEIACGVLACAFLLYKWISYEDYHVLRGVWTERASWNWFACLFACLLLSFNLTAEAAKWKVLLTPLGRRSLLLSIKDVCKGYLGAFVTPNRVGEFPYRAMYLPKEWRLMAVGLGGIGSVMQMGVIVLCGIPALCCLSQTLPYLNWTKTCLVLLFVLLLGLIVGYWVSTSKQTKKLWDDFLMALRHLALKGAVCVLALTLMRYLVFCVQFWLMLEFCGVHLAMKDAWMAIGLYYMLVTLTPSVNVAELAVRGSWAVVALSPFTTNIPAVTLAAWCVWVVNGVLPLLIGLLLKHTNQATRDEILV